MLTIILNMTIYTYKKYIKYSFIAYSYFQTRGFMEVELYAYAYI